MYICIIQTKSVGYPVVLYNISFRLSHAFLAHLCFNVFYSFPVDLVRRNVFISCEIFSACVFCTFPFPFRFSFSLLVLPLSFAVQLVVVLWLFI